MKKTVRVTIEKELEIQIPDHLLTQEHVDSFSKIMWEIDGPDGLFEHAGRQIAYYDDPIFVEGLGPCMTFASPEHSSDAIVFRQTADECEVEVLPHNA